VSSFSFFVIFANQLSSILFTWSLQARLLVSDSGLRLTTSRISQVLRMSSLRVASRSVLPVMHLEVLISVVLSRRLVVSALVLMA